MILWRWIWLFERLGDRLARRLALANGLSRSVDLAGSLSFRPIVDEIMNRFELALVTEELDRPVIDAEVH